MHAHVPLSLLSSPASFPSLLHLPTPTLFPYTTLFRSTAAEVTPIRELDNRPIGSGSCGPITKKLQSMFFDVVKDRKSTRLNSSHRCISYAVFCLKKKKKYTRRDIMFS